MAAQTKKANQAIGKRTSQGRKHMPLNKHKRLSYKKYRGQGHP